MAEMKGQRLARLLGGDGNVPLAQQRATLERSFIAMEQAQSRYQSMTSQLTNAFK